MTDNNRTLRKYTIAATVFGATLFWLGYYLTDGWKNGNPRHNNTTNVTKSPCIALPDTGVCARNNEGPGNFFGGLFTGLGALIMFFAALGFLATINCRRKSNLEVTPLLLDGQPATELDAISREGGAPAMFQIVSDDDRRAMRGINIAPPLVPEKTRGK